MTTNYDQVAPSYDQRYARHAYPGIASAVLAFAGEGPQRILEVGCGSGHWLELLDANGHRPTGLDASPGMLAKAQVKLPAVALVRGQAEALPFADDSFDRVLIVNALHHFSDPRRALHEARRVLGTGGSALIIGMDPAAGQDVWCIYDYFAGTRERDLQRFPAAVTLRTWLLEAGFLQCETFLAERIDFDRPAREALTSGALARHVTSQLSELSDEAYAAGMAAIEAAAAASGDALRLHARLHLYGTTALR